MYLVDTSVWIDYLRQTSTPATQLLLRILDRGLPFGITSAIYQEVLQGATTQRDVDRLREYFGDQFFYHPLDPLESYVRAADLYVRCRRNRITIRSTVDCLIAQTAIEHELVLLHSDRDFIRLAGVVTELKLAW